MSQSVVLVATIVADACHRAFVERALIAAVDAMRPVAAPGDDGTLISTMTRRIAGLNANHLKLAHARIEQGGARGKIVMEGF
jgi:hypothetical protein